MNDHVTISVGHTYWVLGGLFVDQWNTNYLTLQEKTSVFSLKREKWFNGPYLHQALINQTNSYCVTSLNLTSAIFIGVGESARGVILYDFTTNIWTKMADTISDVLWCSCSSAFEKDYKQ